MWIVMASENSDSVLKLLIQDPRATDLQIAKDLGLSAAGVGKIRDKLERSGKIRGYSLLLDKGSMGFNTFGILHLRVTSDGWNYKSGTAIRDFFDKNPNITTAYRIPGQHITHIIICIFRNLKELDRFINTIQAQMAEYIEVVDSFVFSSDSVIKDDLGELAVKNIEEGNEMRMPEPYLFGKIMGD